MQPINITLTSAILAALFFPQGSLAVPVPESVKNYQDGNAYSGAGGNAPGGSVNSSPGFVNRPAGRLGGVGQVLGGGEPLLSAFSNNAGDGGRSSSGPAGTRPGAVNNLLRGGTRITSTSRDGTSNVQAANAFSGAAGQAPGGSVNRVGGGGLIELFSSNAGDGGAANSGLSHSGRRDELPCLD